MTKLSFFELDQMTQDEVLAHYASASEEEKARLEGYIVKREKLLIFSLANNWYKKRSYFSQNVEWEDIHSGVELGFLIALRKYDRSRGTKLSTVVYSWVHSVVGRLFEKESSTIKIPSNVLAKVHSRKEDNRPTEKELNRVLTLSTTFSIDELDEWYDQPEGYSVDPSTHVGNKEVMNQLLDVLRGLDCFTMKSIFAAGVRPTLVTIGVHPEDCSDCNVREPNNYEIKKARKKFQSDLDELGITKDLFKGLLG